MDNNLAAEISALARINLTTNMGNYLGTPPIHGRTTQDLYQHLIDRITTKLESWKSKYLSFVGRHTLAQAVLTALPTNIMQPTLLPVVVCNKINRVVRRFIWGKLPNRVGKVG